MDWRITQVECVHRKIERVSVVVLVILRLHVLNGGGGSEEDFWARAGGDCTTHPSRQIRQTDLVGGWDSMYQYTSFENMMVD